MSKIPTDLFEILKSRADADDVLISEIVRAALEEYLLDDDEEEDDETEEVEEEEELEEEGAEKKIDEDKDEY